VSTSPTGEAETRLWQGSSRRGKRLLTLDSVQLDDAELSLDLAGRLPDVLQLLLEVGRCRLIEHPGDGQPAVDVLLEILRPDVADDGEALNAHEADDGGGCQRPAVTDRLLALLDDQHSRSRSLRCPGLEQRGVVGQCEAVVRAQLLCRLLDSRGVLAVETAHQADDVSSGRAGEEGRSVLIAAEQGESGPRLSRHEGVQVVCRAPTCVVRWAAVRPAEQLKRWEALPSKQQHSSSTALSTAGGLRLPRCRGCHCCSDTFTPYFSHSDFSTVQSTEARTAGLRSRARR
jgi:hypothetical protein